MQQGNQRPLPRLFPHLLAGMGFQQCSKDRTSIRQGIGMQIWYRSIARVVHPLPAIDHIQFGCLSLPSIRSLQRGQGWMEWALRLQRRPRKGQSACATIVQSKKTYRLPVERADECVAIAIFGSSDWRFRLDDWVDTTNCLDSISSGIVIVIAIAIALIESQNWTCLDWRPRSQSRTGSDSWLLGVSFCWQRKLRRSSTPVKKYLGVREKLLELQRDGIRYWWWTKVEKLPAFKVIFFRRYEELGNSWKRGEKRMLWAVTSYLRSRRRRRSSRRTRSGVPTRKSAFSSTQ